MAYDEQGRVYQVTENNIDQSLGTVLSTRTTNYWYDHRGELIKVRSPNGSVTKDHYDGAGRLAWEAATDGGGDTTWLDATTVTGDVVTERSDFTYDDNGNLTATTNALDETTDYAYDALNRLTSTTDANGDATLYAYTAAGNLYSLTDAEQNTTTWTYDLLGRAVTETTAAGTCSYVYNVLGQVTSITMNLDGLTPTVVLTQQFDVNGNHTNAGYTTGAHTGTPAQSTTRCLAAPRSTMAWS